MAKMRTATTLLTLLNLAAGTVCSFLVFGAAWNSSKAISPAYLGFGIIIPAIASLVVTILGILLERGWNWRVIGLNTVAYATVYILIGAGGLHQAITKKEYMLLIWLAFAVGTASISFAGCLLARLIMKKQIAQPAIAPYSDTAPRPPQG